MVPRVPLQEFGREILNVDRFVGLETVFGKPVVIASATHSEPPCGSALITLNTLGELFSFDA